MNIFHLYLACDALLNILQLALIMGLILALKAQGFKHKDDGRSL
jgi:hypothetical protein